MAHKVVLDSGTMPDAKAALGRLAEWAGGGTLVGDLAWTRLTRWREMLSQVFQNRQNLAKLPFLTSVRVWFGAGLETTARYMGAWITNVLADSGVKASLAVEPRDAPSLRVELAGEGFQVGLERRDGRLTVTVNDLTNCTNLPQPTDYLLMREELAIVRRDAVYERTLASASRL
jgi:glucose-6-phosphate dehydrogenase assembly protein OpcA